MIGTSSQLGESKINNNNVRAASIYEERISLARKDTPAPRNPGSVSFLEAASVSLTQPVNITNAYTVTNHVSRGKETRSLNRWNEKTLSDGTGSVKPLIESNTIGTAGNKSVESNTLTKLPHQLQLKPVKEKSLGFLELQSLPAQNSWNLLITRSQDSGSWQSIAPKIVSTVDKMTASLSAEKATQTPLIVEQWNFAVGVSGVVVFVLFMYWIYRKSSGFSGPNSRTDYRSAWIEAYSTNHSARPRQMETRTSSSTSTYKQPEHGTTIFPNIIGNPRDVEYQPL